jgi:hypothetical protein
VTTRKRKIKLPPPVRPSEEELARRAKAIDRMLEIRASMEPLGFSVVEWIHKDRDELEEPSG